RKARPASQLGHAFKTADGSNWHDARDNRDVNARQCAPFSEIEKIPIVEEQLCDDVMSASIHLCLEMIHLNQSIWRRRMPLGKASNSNTETTTVRMRAGFVEAANKFYQIDCVLE